jgi:hypothetical protein
MALSLAYASLLPTPALAQATEMRQLQGTVVDQSGGVIFDAAVSLESRAQQTREIRTDHEGRYGFDQLLPGLYTLTVTSPGFLVFTSAVDLSARATATLDVALTIAVSLSLEVKEAVAGLSTEPQRNLSAFVLTGADLERLPDDPQLFLLRILELAGSTGRPDDVALYVDGFREFKRLPPKNAIEMIRINSNPFSAEFSQPSLRRIEILIKPGSDSFHGDLRVQARHSALDARNPMAATKSDLQYRNYNGYVQGPIVKRRMGFLVYAGEWRQDDNAFVNATLLDSGTNRPQLFRATVSTPTTVRSAMLKTDFRLLNQTINVSYSKTDEVRRNQGLDGGFNLPEHGYDRNADDDVGRLWWTTRGRRTVGDLRFEISRSVDQRTALVSTPAVQVLDAFTAGGNQNAAFRMSTLEWHASEAVTVQQGKHTLKAGMQVDRATQDSIDRSGFGGTFVFGADFERDALGTPVLNSAGEPTPVSPIENYRRSVFGTPGYGPSQFSIVSGKPEVGVEQWNFSWFALDDWSISRRVSLSYGLRQQLQSNVKGGINMAPRASLSWLLDDTRKNAIKVGAGIFYTEVDPGLTLDARKSNGVDRQQLVVQSPPFFAAIPPLLTGSVPVRPMVYIKSRDLVMPYAFVTSIAYERELASGLFGVVQYQATKGVHLLRLRDVIRPPAASSDHAPDPPVLQFESTGRSSRRELMLGLRGHFNSDFTLYGNYTLGRTYSDTDGASTVPADSFDLSSEYGFAADDRRHQLLAGATAHAPGDLLLDASLTIASGRPFNITTGRDNNNDTLFADRPSFATAGNSNVIATPYGLLDPNPQPGDTIIPRNFGREPKQVNVSVAVSKNIGDVIVVTGDVENLLNTRRLFGSNGVLTSPTFGVPNQAQNARRVELTVRYSF